jgi:hypothetical protein
MITSVGKSVIRSSLAGSIDYFAKSIAVGVGDRDESESDTDLEFEYVRLPIVVGAVRGTEVVFKATLPIGATLKVSEIGLFSFETNPISGKFTGIMLSEFSEYEGWYAVDGGAQEFVFAESADLRIGQSGLSITNYADGGTKTYSSSPTLIDLSGYSGQDTIRLSFVQGDSKVDSIIVSLQDIAGAVVSHEYEVSTIPGASEYVVLSAPISDFHEPDFLWGSVTNISLTISYKDVSSNSNLILDGLKVFDSDSPGPQYAMIGRIVLPEPTLKESGVALDVEYGIDVTL